jgi:hypothetical protein
MSVRHEMPAAVLLGREAALAEAFEQPRLRSFEEKRRRATSGSIMG